MKKFLLVGAAIVFAGVAATVAVAADHKGKPAEKPARAAIMTPAKATTAHKGSAPKRHHVVKRHHTVHRTHAK
jgi:hypothetical protein